MFEFTGTVVGYDDFLLPSSSRDPSLHQFHVVVEKDATREWVRLRVGSGIAPLTLASFGKGANLEEIREMLGMGSRIIFAYRNVADAQRTDPNYHEMDVIVNDPSAIAVARCKTNALSRPRLVLVQTV
ncbi:MAG: hypothetical protein AAB473_02435 [Patescibacteria group bacterium]